MHALGLVKAMKACLRATEKIWMMDTLFILSEEPKEGQAAAEATITRWFKQLISQAYGLKGLPPPFIS